MSPERWRQVKEVLGATLDRRAEERDTFLAAACADDEELRAEVESLLASHEDSGDFLEQPAGSAPRIEECEDDLIDAAVGAYRIVSKIGHGGMGVVYKAVRSGDEFRQEVAIKLISRGMDTQFIVNRFRGERRILASLDHPNIGRLLDGGATADGRPYFVMEYIEGDALPDYCDKHRLSTTERLKLFRKICAAVQYAHQNLIVHRDLKPSNILVNTEGEPKLLDFGIAKILSMEVSPHTLDPTLTMYRMMTPDYASPEQVRGEKITTASDIYSLGVVLYELLTGHRPYRVTTQAPREIEEIICRREPDRPSTVVGRVVDVRGVRLTPALVSETREGTPEKLKRRLRGDLDNIVLMAMRKEPQRRYASVGQLSEDIRKHLEGFAVLARSDTFAYRASKFVQRHKAGVLAAALVALALVAGIITTAWQAHVANRERLRAEHRFNDVKKLADSMMFELHDAIERLPGSTAARELLVRKAMEYLNSLAHEAEGDPTLQRELALVYLKVGDVQGRPYRPNLGNTPAALDSYGRALEIYKRLAADDASNLDLKRSLADSYESMCAIQEAMGRAGEAEQNCMQMFELRQAVAAAQPDNAITRRELAAAHQGLANALALSGKWDRVKENRRKALAIFEELEQADPVDRTAQKNVATAYMKLGRTLLLTGEYAASLEAQRKSLEIDEALLQESPADPIAKLNVSFNYHFMAQAQFLLGDRAGALANCKRALAIREQLAVSDPLDARVRTEIASTYGLAARLLIEKGDLRAAGPYLEKQLTLEEGLVATDPVRVEHQAGLADAEAGMGDLEARRAWLQAARSWYQRSLDIYAALSSQKILSAEFSNDAAQTRRKLAACEASGRAKP